MNLFPALEAVGLSPWSSVDPRPRVDEHYESNVKGVYVIGDVVDAPVIKLALRQGRQVADTLSQALGKTSEDPDQVDVAIVGAGPAGIAAAEALTARGLRVLVLEKARPFETVHAFPKGKPIYAEPDSLPNTSALPFEDAPKETLTQQWTTWLDASSLPVHAGEAVTSLGREGDGFVVHTQVGSEGRDSRWPTLGGEGSAGAKNRYRARRVVVAVGKRGAVRKLGVPGDSLPKVRHALVDPIDHAGRRVLVVGGGDSAVEAAIATAQAGAEVSLSYRRATLSRPKKRNQDALDALIAEGKVTYLPESHVVSVHDDLVVLRTADGQRELPNDDVLVFIGAGLPRDLLRRLGISMEGELQWGRAAWVVGFMALVYAFYVLKQKKGFFPFGEGDPLGFVPDLLQVDLGFRMVDAGFWGTVIYSLLIAGFGVFAYRRHRHVAEQRRRYISLITFQFVFLFGIPELIIPGLHAVASTLDATSGTLLDVATSQGWMAYAFSVPWPLSLWSVINPPWWVPSGGEVDSLDWWTAILWTGLGLTTSFVLMPLYVWRNNERFCSWLCGCGGLAETMGDTFRHLAPRGAGSRRLEWAGVVILFMAVPTTLLMVNDAWQVWQTPFLSDAHAFAKGWYMLAVDFMLASFVGVAFYPVLGNRVWCRFFCPLRAYMEILARGFGRLQITSTDTCISCGACTRYCQMGIEVQQFAEVQLPLDNTNSACIQCGICVEVCPMDVLSLQPKA